jgi:hypothetical protein
VNAVTHPVLICPARVLGVAAAFATAITLMACDPGAMVTYVNATDRRVIVYLGDDLDDRDAELAPYETVEGAMIEAVWEDVVVIRDPEGNVLFREPLTWSQLSDQDYRIVITDEGLSE